MFQVTSGVRVTGLATSFDTEVVRGDYLYSSSLNETREVKHVLNPELIELATAFSGVVAMDAVNIIKRTAMSNILQVGILNSGAMDAVVDEDTLGAGTSVNFSDVGGVGPLTFDGTGTILGISQKLRG